MTQDLSAVVALERAIAEAPHWAEEEYAASIGGQVGVLRVLLVAEAMDGERLVGFAVGKVIPAAELAELESVAVESGARRFGVGRRLCEAVAEWCREKGAKDLELEVRESNAGAILLYERLGFAVAGRRAGYYRGPDEDALLMQMSL